MTKEHVKQAIDFLKTVANEDFIADQQTLDFSGENVGKKHCVYGHLVLNPKSPFYNVEHEGQTVGFSNLVTEINNAVKPPLHEVNNNSSNEERKEAVIKKLEELFDSIV